MPVVSPGLRAPPDFSICSAFASAAVPSRARAKVRVGARGRESGTARPPGIAEICASVMVRLPSSRSVMAETKASGPAAATCWA